MTEPPRELTISGTFNLRDLGGLPLMGGGQVRRGMVFRCGSLVDLTADGAEALHALGLRTIIDLREPIEDNVLPEALAGAEAVHAASPIYRGEFDFHEYPGLGELYSDVIDRAGDRLAEVIARLARPGAVPALVHCSAGKDRTGLVVALLLAALGVPAEAIVEDFALSEQYFVGAVRDRALQRAIDAGMTAQGFAVIAGAPPELMRAVLARVDAAAGSAAGYLVAHGLPETDLGRLRDTLVEAPA